MTTYPWPPELRAIGIQFDLAGQAAAGPPSLIGNSQVASLDGGYWVAVLSDINIVGRDNMLSFRRLRAVLQGGAHQVLVPVCDYAPWPGEDHSAVATFSDTATFSDGSTFSQGVISVGVVTAAAVRTTRLEVSYDSVGSIVGGEFFSIGKHLYQIAQVLDETPPSGADAVWQIVPPLREAIDSSTYLNFDKPRCMMRPLRESEMNAMTFRNRTAIWSPTFVETFEVE